ncbi:hypothetical protein CASFOL_028464 [Castilleja foliolosa]|uniref:Mitochondrial import inner membrane translocase subunit TIM50 n=1 Tax=Castilleja foliolosa TaxID=1961234 RepID=A0ABD3CDH4_9LAMI
MKQHTIRQDRMQEYLDVKFYIKASLSRTVHRTEGSYTKDLTILGVDLAKVAIIDNSPQVFRFQVNNGIPIKSWFNNPTDTELILLLPFLETILVNADDIRPIIAMTFGNKFGHLADHKS